jgi:hypothetical protein
LRCALFKGINWGYIHGINKLETERRKIVEASTPIERRKTGRRERERRAERRKGFEDEKWD